MSKALNAPTLLKPKAAVIWLVENTAMTFEQIAEFTGLHSIEVQALADGDVGRGIIGERPSGLSDAELEKAANDSTYIPKLDKQKDLPTIKTRAKGPKYTPVSKRGDKPDAIAWILKHHPEISDAQICKLVGTTKPTINAIRERTHANISAIKPRHPAELGLCSYKELEAASDKGLKAQGKDPEAVKAEKQKQMESEMAQPQEETAEEAAEQAYGGFDFSNFVSGTKADPNNQD
ncbi:MAG: cell cycle transcriptional regulator TrcR [Pseudomonadota bacterium]